MKDFIEKNRKLLFFILIIFLLLAVLTGIYFLFLKDSQLFNKDTNTNAKVVNSDDQEKEVTPLPEYELVDSSKILKASLDIAQGWSTDAKLTSCSGLPLSSVKFTDITYTWVGYEEGKYYSWMCQYDSKVKNATLVITFKGLEADYDYDNTVDAGEYGMLSYKDIPLTDVDRVVNSTDVYGLIKDIVDTENNYINMYLTDTNDYGFVWNIEERSKTEKDEYDIGVLVHTFLVDMYTGVLKDTLEEEVY